ncbi:hypothetical protein K435DRAFT_795578 [Dendrothele bispora CBS 962.96]|uniref:Uncharacterized protein n=1 Tax=Dendrothele bispora (strain CBS 962.96) TaxID=1314807 RepID=A0A4S8M8E5_DENBC|nr:hypothetical protein K435DRAFT_795578 [Dendrothele bispora CBS 962.96]
MASGSTSRQTTKRYAFEASRKTVQVLKGVVEMAGVPLVKEVLEIGLSLIEACEELNEVQERVRHLKNKVAEFLLVIAQFMDKPQNTKLPPHVSSFFAEMSEDLERELGDLKNCLDSITKRLEHIKGRNVLVTAVLSETNLDEIKECETDFEDAIERFQTLRTLHAAEDVAKIQDKLELVHSEIKVISQQVTQLQTSFDDLKARLGPLDESRLVVPTMPNPPSIFHGRDTVVNEIANILSHHSSDGKRPRFCILGSGGLGKTSAALAVMKHPLIQRTFGGGQFWIPCNTANSSNALLDALAEGTGVNPQSKNLLRSILTRLSSSAEPCVLLLDNFETPWLLDEGSQSDVRALLEQLDALPNVVILLTMRSNSPPLRHWTHTDFPPVHLEDSRKIYLDVDETAGVTSDLDALLDALGHLPGAVYLMANLGLNSLSTPAKLLEQWRAGGINVMDHCVGLSMKSSFVTGCEGAIELLQVLAMLPAGVLRSHLELWFSSYRPEAIQCLRKAALLHVSSGSDPKLFVLPVIQSCVQKGIHNDLRQRVYSTCCRILMDHNGAIDGPNNPLFKAHSRFIRSEQPNIESLLTEMLNSILSSHTQTTAKVVMDQLDAFRVFIWYRYWSQPHVELAVKVARAAEITNNATSQADTLLCLGKMYRITGRSDDALKTLARARELFSSLDNSRRNRRNAMRCEVTYTEMSALVRGLRQEDVIPLVEALQPQCQGEDTYLEALRLESLSAFQFKAHYFEPALASITRTRDLFKENNCPFDAATCLLDLARILGCLERYDEALEVANEAVSSFHDLGFEGYNTCFSYILKARIMQTMKCPDNSILEVLNGAIEHSHQEPLPLAFTLLEYGEIYLKRKDWRAATLAYEEARNAISRLDKEGHRGIPDECANKLQVIRRYETQGADPPAEELASLIPAPRLFP